ncbi:MAG: STAS domain-containing protein [Candidatus Sumerlaeia bacterium]|nr:STAS domain-containing protein [Candidatus Sumerlaeia bacterium]
MVHELVLCTEPYQELGDLHARLPELFSGGVKVIVVDLAATPFIDSMVIGQLVKLQLECHRRSGLLELRNIGDNARRTLGYSGLAELFGLDEPEPPRFGRP